MVDDLESLVASGIVYAGDVYETLELALRMISEEGEDGEDSRGCDVDGELVLPY